MILSKTKYALYGLCLFFSYAHGAYEKGDAVMVTQGHYKNKIGFFKGAVSKLQPGKNLIDLVEITAAAVDYMAQVCDFKVANAQKSSKKEILDSFASQLNDNSMGDITKLYWISFTDAVDCPDGTFVHESWIKKIVNDKHSPNYGKVAE